MSTENTLSDAERKRVWNEVAAEEAYTESQAGEASAQITSAGTSAAPPQPAAKATGYPATTEGLQGESFAGVPQEVRDYMAGLQEQVAQLAGRVRSNEGSIGGLKSAMQRNREAAQAVRDGGGDAPTARELRAAQAGGQRAMDKLREQYPEFAEQLGEVLKEELSSLREAQPAQPQGPSPEEVAVARREAYIEGKGFAGWSERIRQADFIGWFKRQPREVQMLGHSPDWDDAVRLLQIHREQSTTPSSRQGGRSNGRHGGRDLSGFSGVSELHRSHPQTFSGTRAVDQMTPQEFWRHLNELEAQQIHSRG